ncbi:MAG: DUF3987 domain-containing protein [Glaciimonas sp.]|nr:DUF3987 domain-containing protein [Glaciimonas sp.]
MNAQYPPIDALPSIIRNTVLAVQAETKAPVALVLSVVLGVVSLTCQNSINVRRPNMPASSCSLNVLIIALSGERKSAVTNLVLQAVREFMEREAQKSKLKLFDYEAKFAAWKIGHAVILASIEKHEKKYESNEQLTLRLSDHLAKEPQKPLILKLIYNDATPEALLHGLSEWPSAGLISDEASGVLNGRVVNDMGLLNKLWDGTTQSIERRGAGITVIKEPRLTTMLAIQDSLMMQFLDSRGDQARGSGLLARNLITRPDSTQGTRFIGYQPQPPQNFVKFHARVTEILNKNARDMEGDNFIRDTLGFMPDAEYHWVQNYNTIELAMAPGGYFTDIKEYAAKIAENIARMAALFHYFEGGKGDISFEMVDSAASICNWYANEYKRLFGPVPEIPQVQKDADLLVPWLGQCAIQNRTWQIKRRNILQYCPNILRKKDRLDAVLHFLAMNNYVQLIFIGKSRYVELNPQFFPLSMM